MQVTVYGIKSCSTVKRARAWLDSHGIEHSWVDFRATPVVAERIARWVDALGSRPLRNTSGSSYRALGDEKKSWGDAEWLPRFQEDPMLLKRPVLELDGAAVAVGFGDAAYARIFG